MNTPIQVMIVEDEAIVAMDLSMGLQKDGYHVVGIADNFADAVALFQQQPVDILLMDIHIHGDKDGVECATELMKIKEVPLIYLTAYSDASTIERVKQTKPAAFLTKPYSINNVRVAIDLALHHFAEAKLPQQGGKIVAMQDQQPSEKKTDISPLLLMNNYIFLKQGFKFVKLKIDELLYVESDNNYVYIITRSHKFSLRLSLSELLEQIHFPALIRVHRSYAVNLNEIVSFDDQSIKTEKQEIPIGRNYKEAFFKHFNLR